MLFSVSILTNEILILERKKNRIKYLDFISIAFSYPRMTANFSTKKTKKELVEYESNTKSINIITPDLKKNYITEM